MNDTVSSEYLRDQGRAAMARLLGGDRFRCRRILVDVSALKVPFACLDLVARAMADRCGDEIDRVFLPLREVVHSALDRIGVVVLATSFYGRFAADRPDRVFDEAERLVVRGRRSWIADLVAANIMRPLLGEEPLLALPCLWHWAEDGDPWLRRAVAVTVNQRLKSPDCDASALVYLLESIRLDTTREVRCGVVMALRTLCRNHRAVGLSTLKTWAHDADARVVTVVRGGMIGLGVTQRRELEAVLAAR